MRNSKLLAILSFLLFTAISLPASEAAYDYVYAELSKQQNRLPGSVGYEQSKAAIKKVLADAKLTHGEQTYNTTIVKTLECNFTVDGKKVSGVYPVQPNQYATTTTSGRTLEGPCFYLGKGHVDSLDKIKIRGSIILLDLDSENTKTLFNLGALAVIFVGSEDATQWQLHEHGVEQPIHLPRAFISRKEAQKQGLLENSNKNGSIRISTKWASAEATNIWVHLPANQSTEGVKDCILLTATYDTFGFVPDYSPQLRFAANSALLAQTVIDLSKQKRSRDIIAVFLGSHYSALEGARYAHWAAKNAYKNDKPSTYFEDRQKNNQDEIEYYKRLKEFMAQDNFIGDLDNELHRDAKKIFRKALDKVVGNILYEIGIIAIKADKEDNKELKEKEKKLRDQKLNWSNLLGEVMRSDNDAGTGISEENKENFNTILIAAQAKLDNIIQDLMLLAKHNATNQSFSKVFGSNRIIMQLNLDFANDTTPWLHNFTGDHSSLYTFLKVGLGFFDSHIRALNKVYDESVTDLPAASLFKYKHATVKPESLCTPNKRMHAALTALTVGTFGYSLNTVGDALNKDDIPDHTDVSLKKLTPSLIKYFTALSNSKSIAIAYSGELFKIEERLVYTNDGKRRDGVHASNFVKGGTDLEGSASNALMTVFFPNELPNKQPGHTNYIVSLTDTLGYILSPHMANLRWQHSRARAFGFDEYGAIIRIGEERINTSKHVKLFFCFGGGTLVPLFPVDYEKFPASKFYKGKTDAPLVTETSLSFEDKNSVGVYNYREENIKIINTSGIRILGASDTKPSGYGVEPDAQVMINVDPITQTSEDLVRLNESRLVELRKKNIVLEDIETLHANAKDHLEQAKKYKENDQHLKAMSHGLYSATLANHAYTPLVGTTNDMIKAVVILLILSIPFAFSLERLFFGFTTIYKQVAGFLGFFIATFVLLYFAHPAFSLASSPIIIFLAFVIIIMSGMVIVIIMSKFKREILALQGMQSSTHGSGGGGNTALASVVIGISTMRNRPLKTFLTAFTIILLTFTILVFASFGSTIGVNETYEGQNSSVERIEIKRNAYMMLPKHLQHSINEFHKDTYTVVNRGAYYPYPYDGSMEGRECVLYIPKSNTSLILKAALGVDPVERKENPEIDKVYPETLDPNIESPLYLDESISSHLELKVGDKVVLNGKEFQFGGNFNRSAIKSASYLDDMKLVPPDFEATKGEDKELSSSRGESLGALLAQIDTSSFRWIPVDSLALIDYKDLKSIRGFHNAMILYPAADVDIGKDARNIAEIFESPVYAKSKEGIQSYFYTQSFDSSGVNEIIVPLLLGGLIIFSSLLGSIVDREREIFTFSALGLAPPNVAALFFAESSVYAVIGGLGGYIISQLAAVFLAWLSDIGIFQAPEMNFSSLSSTYTILLVMATVILSTIYPAMKAGKSANPGIARKWQMPNPDGDSLSFVFPFTVGSHDLGGILHFIAEHFENHKDASLGKFAASNIEVGPIDEINYRLSATVSLAPFDLGIFQEFSLRSQPSDIEGILEIVVELKRISGSPPSWIRNNRNFLDDLRNQFLLWRSLPAETVAHYTEAAREQESAHD